MILMIQQKLKSIHENVNFIFKKKLTLLQFKISLNN